MRRINLIRSVWLAECKAIFEALCKIERLTGGKAEIAEIDRRVNEAAEELRKIVNKQHN